MRAHGLLRQAWRLAAASPGALNRNTCGLLIHTAAAGDGGSWWPVQQQQRRSFAASSGGSGGLGDGARSGAGDASGNGGTGGEREPETPLLQLIRNRIMVRCRRVRC